MSTSKTLEGKIAVVSGSVGGGIGTAIANELSFRGANVVLNYPWASMHDDAVKAATQLETPGIAVEADLSTIEGPQKFVRETVEKYGRIDILVDNASIAYNDPLEVSTLVHESPQEEARRTKREWNTTLRGPRIVCT